MTTVYLTSVYEDPKLRKEFQAAYKATGKKLKMGGGCVHFESLDDLPLEVVGDMIARVAVEEYVERYKRSRAKMKKSLDETQQKTKKSQR